MEAFERGIAQEALELFQAALSLRPTQDEARAALYNSACARARLRQWQEAADDVVRACNEYGLKFEVAAKDPDLRQLRERREWLDTTSAAVGAVSLRTKVSARTELRAPLRLARLFASGGLAAGAGLGLIIITGRLVSSLRGGPGAPDLNESLINFAINSAALAALSWVFARDLRSQSRDRRVVEREEALARLQVRKGEERILPLARLRGQVRPVLLAGSAGYVNRAMRAAEPLRAELRERGVAVVPLVLSDEDPEMRLQALKAQFRAGASSDARGFAKADAVKKEERKKKDARWELEAADVPEWGQWLSEQREAAGIKSDGVYVQVQLDGSVRASGTGMPPWERWVSEIPELDSLQTRLTDGVGT